MKVKNLLLACMLTMICLCGRAQIQKVYVNPVQNQASVSSNSVNRIGTKIIFGLSKARTIEATKGDKQMSNKELAEAGYQIVINPTVTKASHKQDTELLSTKLKDTYTAELTVQLELINAATGEKMADGNIHGTASRKDIQLAYYEAAKDFDDRALDFIDNNIRIVGEVTEVDEGNNDKEAKQVRVNVGASKGVRQELMFNVFKVTSNDQSVEIGKARCERVLGQNESILKIYGNKDGDKAVYDALQNMDGSYRIMVVSRSTGDLATYIKGKLPKFKKERGFFYEPELNRSAKLKVGVKSCVSGNSNVNSSVLEAIANAAAEGFSQVTTIEFIPKYFNTLEQAKQSGLDGLIDISCDNMLNTNERMKDGKTQYKTEIYVTMAGINVHTGTWIEMRESDKPAYSTENQQKAQEQAVSFLVENFKKFAEDVFPVAGLIIDEAKVDKKGRTDEANINIGSAIGVRKNMMFDIYEQYKEGGSASRYYLGKGKVTGTPESNSAVINVKGENHGEEKVHELLTNNSGELELVIISRAYGGIGTLINGLRK